MRCLQHSNWHRATMTQSIMISNSAKNVAIQQCWRGLQVFIQTAAGAGNFPQQTADSLVALLSFSGEMHHPLYAGDTAYPGLEIVKLTPQRTTGIIEMRAIVLNQHDQLIMEGTHRYLVKKIQPVDDESL